MIADKIMKSFYLVEIEGQAVNCIFTGDFGIKKIMFGSRDFETDMMAMNALSGAVNAITDMGIIDVSQATEQLDFNPEFFPTQPAIVLTEEQKTEIDACNEAIEEMNDGMQGTDQMAIPVTHMFDKLGDFIGSRWTIEAPDWKITGRVSVHPDDYAKEKAREIIFAREELMPSKNSTTLGIH